MAARVLLSLLCIAALCCGCGVEKQSLEGRETRRPTRIVSVDYCADQYVIKLVERERILALSPDATAEFSYMSKEAAGIPTVRPVAEDVLILKPDLVVRSYGGGPNATAFFERAGVPVLNVGWAADIPAVLSTIEAMAEGLAVPASGQRLIEEMQARLERLKSGLPKRSALYMTPAGVTTGPGSLVHEMILAAGLDNFQQQRGWQPLPLERLAYENPDLVAAAFFDTRTNHPNAWSPTRHPVARAELRNRRVVSLRGAWTACAGWFLMDAVEALAASP